MLLLALLAIAMGTAALLALLLFGLFEAPWPVLLFFLVLALYKLQTLSAQGAEPATEADPVLASQPAASKPMTSKPVASQPVVSKPVASQPVVSQPMASQKVAVPAVDTASPPAKLMVYRGVRYVQPQPAREPDSGPPTITEGIYRGQRWQRSRMDHS